MQNWNVNPKKAVQIQQELRHKIVLKKLGKKIQFIAGTSFRGLWHTG